MGRAEEKREEKRADLVRRLVPHVLATGLADAGLRRLAEVAGTSDRMLLYYFENKDELVTAILVEIGAEIARTLAERAGSAPLAPARALELLWAALQSDVFAEPLRLWLDLSSRASRGDSLCGAVVDRIAADWIEWLGAMLDAPEADRASLATLMMGAVDGQLVLFPTEPAKGDAAIRRLVEMLERR